MSAITILELAEHRGVEHGEDGAVSAAALAAVGLGIMGGCEACAATIAAYNACPSKSGCWRCRDCIGDDGWPTAEEADAAIFGGRMEVTL